MQEMLLAASIKRILNQLLNFNGSLKCDIIFKKIQH